MGPIRLDEAAGLTVADVVHSRVSALPASSTIGDVRAWFAGSASRRLAVLADNGLYVGSLVPEDVAGDVDAGRAATEVAQGRASVDPEAPASRAKELALGMPAQRVPVVDADGRLVGIVAITPDLRAFCGTGGSSDC